MSFRTYFDVPGADRSALGEQVAAQRARVARRLASVARVVAIVSGKGGVGKSYVTAAVAAAAARHGTQVGVVDADLKSPTVARMLGATGPLAVTDDGVAPASGAEGVRVVSSDFLLDDGRPLAWREPEDDRFVWRGALEAAALREFLGDVTWGRLDLLLVDLPPGADGVSDLAALVPQLSGALAVTLPSDESGRSVARTMHALRDAGIPLLGVVENMSGYHCDACREDRPLFAGHAGDTLADAFRVPLLAQIPFDGSAQPAAPADTWRSIAAALLEGGRGKGP